MHTDTRPGTAALPALLLALALAAPVAGQAQTTAGEPDRNPPVDQNIPSETALRALLDAALPAVINDTDNSALVAALLSPDLGPPLRESFNAKRAESAVFGRSRVKRSPECRASQSAVGDPSSASCVVSVGEPNGTGAYLELRYDAQMGRGNINLNRREASRESVDPSELPNVTKPDSVALAQGLDVLTNTFGLPSNEFLTGESSVRDMKMNWIDEEGREPGSTVLNKVLFLRRMLAVNETAVGQPRVMAPGVAKLALGEADGVAGVDHAIVQGWMELVRHPNADPSKAKTRTALLDEITRDLMTGNVGGVDSVRAYLYLSGVPDKARGLLLPAVQVVVVPVPEHGIELEPGQPAPASTAVLVKDYALLDLDESLAGDDD